MRKTLLLSAFVVLTAFSSSGIKAAYCTANGNSTQFEWIASFAFGSFSCVSGVNSGYGNYTGMTINAIAGTNYTIVMTPGYTKASPEYWRVWIDYNNDQDFTDAGELAYDAGAAYNGPRTGSITIPAGQATVTTRLRVAMRYNAAPSSCGTFSYGEVEDYTISITSCSDAFEANNTMATAKVIALNTNVSAKICGSGDVDWFRFTTSSVSPYLKVTLNNLAVDLDLFLYNSAGVLLGQSTYTGTTPETIIFNSSAAATYNVKVIGFNGAFSSVNYILRASAQGGPWRAEDSPLESIKYPEEISDAKPMFVTGFNCYPNPSEGNLSLSFMSVSESRASLRIIDLSGKEVFTANPSIQEGLNEISLENLPLDNGIYLLEFSSESMNEMVKISIAR